MFRKLIMLALLTTLTVGLAQRDLESPEYVATSEGGLVFAPDSSNEVAPVDSLLDMIYECNRTAGSLIWKDGKEQFRVYGFRFVGPEEYALTGNRAFSSAARSAETRAMGSATEYLYGVATWVSRYDEQMDSTATAATSTGAPNDANRERISSVSLNTKEVFRNVVRTRSAGFLKGGMATGTRFTSLGDQNGYCVVVRYDIPLDQTGPPPGRQGTGGQQSGSIRAEPAPPTGPTGYPQLPPGTAGDF